MVSPLIDKFTGKIFLKKTKFFGLKKCHAEILFTQTLKIILIRSNITNLPYKIGDNINFQNIKEWSKDNGYLLELTTKNNKIKRLFYFN
jgi:hypothetical protein